MKLKDLKRVAGTDDDEAYDDRGMPDPGSDEAIILNADELGGTVLPPHKKKHVCFLFFLLAMIAGLCLTKYDRAQASANRLCLQIPVFKFKCLSHQE